LPTKEHEAEVVLGVHAQLGEGPVWDERRGELFFVDIMGHRVHSLLPVTKQHRSFDVGRPVGCVVLREDGGLLMAAHDAFFLANADGSALERFASPGVDGNVVRFNDGKVCPRGRLLAGTMDWAQKEPLGCLYMLHADKRIFVLLEGVTISNGLAWSEDGTTLYYIDTPTQRVDAFDFDLETGSIANRRTIAELPGTSPDGMTIDVEGCLWVACWGGHRVQRVDPTTGRVLEVVRVPATQVSSVAFGGADLDELYITTAWDGLTEGQRAADPHAGDLFVARPGVAGRPAYRFGVQRQP
jgi:sugar lactone lactonase YvrE